MRAAAGPVLVLCSLLLTLTILLVQGTEPDIALHERTITALHHLVLDEASLQRDVLKARAGRLPNYDLLVNDVERLRAEVAALREASRIADGPAADRIVSQYKALTDAVAAQEEVIESFKSDNALLRNSLRYFAFVSERLSAVATDTGASAARDIALVAGAMLRLVSEGPDLEADTLSRRLDQLQNLTETAGAQDDIDALLRHGRLIAARLPELDRFLAQLLATPVTAHAGALQSAYLDAHKSQEVRATWSRWLLYAGAIGLLVWLAWLVWSLQARLRFEKLVAGIADRFIGLPREQLAESMTTALADIARQIGAVAATAHLAGRMADSAGWIVHWPDPHSVANAALRVPLGGNGSWLAFRAGRRWRWHTQDRALLQAAGNILGGVVEWDRAAAEKEKLEAALHQAQRMEAVGTLAGGIAHDFRNILGAILGYAEMALDALPHDSSVGGYVRQMQDAGERAHAVVEQLLMFSRNDPPDLRALRLERVFAKALGLLRASLPDDVVLEQRITSDAAAVVVLGDASRLQLALLNLGTNAAQAMDGRGVLTVTLDTVEAVQSQPLSHGLLPAGHQVRLAVTDTGHGIDPVTAQRIFEPFFTTKPRGQGTGLGLASVWGVVADHHGVMNVLSRPGEGSTFEVYLPRIEAALSEATVDCAQSVMTGNGQVILVVDDERPLVLLIEEMLAGLGYEPVGFTSATQALIAVQADPARFDLVLTDAMMPEMTGIILAGALHHICPDLPIVLITGFAGHVTSEELRTARIVETLRKPLAARTVAEALARHLAPSR